MARGDPITADERQRMATLVREGRSVRAVARDLDRPQSSVSTIVRAEGVEPTNVHLTKAMQDGRIRWGVEQRTRLGAQAFDKLEQVLPDIDKMRDLRDWSVAFGVMTDKMRLESDLSTSNVEVHEHLTIEQRQAIRELLTGG